MPFFTQEIPVVENLNVCDENLPSLFHWFPFFQDRFENIYSQMLSISFQKVKITFFIVFVNLFIDDLLHLLQVQEIFFLGQTQIFLYSSYHFVHQFVNISQIKFFGLSSDFPLQLHLRSFSVFEVHENFATNSLGCLGYITINVFLMKSSLLWKTSPRIWRREDFVPRDFIESLYLPENESHGFYAIWPLSDAFYYHLPIR